MVNLISDIKQRCLRCGKTALITDTETGEIVCGGCGFVVSDDVDKLRDIIILKIRKLDRIRSTLTLMVISGQE